MLLFSNTVPILEFLVCKNYFILEKHLKNIICMKPKVSKLTVKLFLLIFINTNVFMNDEYAPIFLRTYHPE